MERILVVNVNWIGDVIFSSPVFKALKENYPNARISCMAVPRVKEVLKCIPYIDEIIEYDEKGRHRHPWAKLSLVFLLRKKRFDAAFLLHRSLTRALLASLSGIPLRVGYDEKNLGKLLTQRVEHLEGTVHRCDHYLNVIESYGIKVKDRRSQLTVEDHAMEKVKAMLKDYNISDEDYIVAVNPGGNWDLKRWPVSQYAQLVKQLRGLANAKVIISGAPKDTSLAAMIKGPKKGHVAVLTGKTDLSQLMALMKRADILISADSGPLHMANSVGTDVIGIYGPTRPEITGPRGTGRAIVHNREVGCNREPCYHVNCNDNICMQSNTVADVLKSIQQFRNS